MKVNDLYLSNILEKRIYLINYVVLQIARLYIYSLFEDYLKNILINQNFKNIQLNLKLFAHWQLIPKDIDLKTFGQIVDQVINVYKINQNIKYEVEITIRKTLITQMQNQKDSYQNQHNLAYVDRYPINTGQYINTYIPFIFQSPYSDRQCDLQKMKQQIQMHWQKMAELQKSILKMRKTVKNVSIKLPKPTSKDKQIAPRGGDQRTEEKSDRPKGKRQMKQLRRLDIIRRFEVQSRCGVTFSTFCQMNSLSQRTVRRWISNK